MKLHANDREAWRHRVLLNGVPMERVWVASEERGEVEIVATDAQGYVDLKDPRFVTLCGTVEIVRR